MGLSLVRCPFCDRRYNVSGIPAGTRILCTHCRSVLAVPALQAPAREPLWRRAIPQTAATQVVVALVGGLALAGAAYVGLREARRAVEVPARIAPAPPESPRPEREFVRQTREDCITIFVADTVTEFGPTRFSYQDCPPFLMAAEPNEKVMLSQLFSYYEPALNLLYESFMREFQGPLGLSDARNEVFPVVIFTSRESWNAYCLRQYGKVMPREIPGVYEYSNRRIVMVHDRSQAPLEVLMHEGTHQLVHHFTRQRCGEVRKATYWWFQEGLGTYFEGARRDGSGELVVGRHHHTRVRVVQDALRDNRQSFLPLSKLMGMTIDDVWREWYRKAEGEKEQEHRTRVMQLAYGEACTLVLFLRHGADGRYRRVFDEYFAAELRGEGSRAKFEELLRKHHPRTDLGELQSEFEAFVESIRSEE
jgi:hypothetical protein